MFLKFLASLPGTLVSLWQPCRKMVYQGFGAVAGESRQLSNNYDRNLVYSIGKRSNQVFAAVARGLKENLNINILTK